MTRTAWGLVLLLIVDAPVAWAEVRVQCSEGCEARGANQSVNLLVRKDHATPVVIQWVFSTNPQTNGILTLYAGNPTLQATITERAPLQFRETSDHEWKATRQFSGEEVGQGTFLAVVTQRSLKSERETSGENEAIVDWRAFRLLTTVEKLEQEHGVLPGNAGGVTVTPALLQASTGHGDLPPSLGGDEQAWWSLPDKTTDLDLDGDATGIPGVGIQVSPPWHIGKTEDFKQMVQKMLPGVEGHEVRFGELEWTEEPDRTVTLADKTVLDIRHYYTVVTLFTQASVKTFAAQELNGGLWDRLRDWALEPTYFSHETSARLKHRDDPRVWASYREHEYSADPRLLHILQRQVEQYGTVPGLGSIQQDDGDGGSPRYTAAFSALVRPWDSGKKGTKGHPEAGFFSVDVVAARAGIGGVLTQGKGDRSPLTHAWCTVVGCADAEYKVDMKKPPPGYQLTQEVASLATISGQLPMILKDPRLAQRGEKDPKEIEKAKSASKLPDLPQRVRFGVSADLRSGALLQKGSWDYIQNLVPINAYAQFVIQLTVVMVPGTDLVTTQTRIIPRILEFMVHTITPDPEETGLWAWMKSHPMIALGVLGGVVGLAAYFGPGVPSLARSVVGLITQAFQLLVDLLSLWLKKLKVWVTQKKGD